MAKITHKTKIRMANRMRTVAESRLERDALGKRIGAAISIFSSRAWNERHEAKAARELARATR